MGSVCGSQSYVKLDEEFAVSDADWKWLISHTEYTEQELQSMLFGFREEYPGGGIYRHQFEQMTGNIVMNVIFNCLDSDSNGYLDFKEFHQALQLLSAKTTNQKLEYWNLNLNRIFKLLFRWAFEIYDEDNSGMIDQREMNNVMSSLYKMLEGMGNRPSGDPKVRAKDIFSSIDVNQDGTLTKDEFIKGCQTDEELMMLLEKLFETLLECRVNLHGVLTKLKIKYMKK